MDEALKNDILDSITQKVNQAVSTSLQHVKEDIIQEITSSSKRTLESDVTERISTKLKQNETPHFKRQFNRRGGTGSAEEGGLDKVKDKLEEGKKLVYKRQKLIRIADREEDGCWEVVKCYLSDNLADDSEDEKRLLRSRRQAAVNKKRFQEKRKPAQNNEKRMKHLLPSKSESPSSSFVNNKTFLRNDSANFRLSCYLCGEKGHFARNRPAKS